MNLKSKVFFLFIFIFIYNYYKLILLQKLTEKLHKKNLLEIIKY